MYIEYRMLSLSVHEFCNLIGQFVWEIIPYLPHLLGQTDQTGSMSPYSLFDVSLSLLFRCFVLFF